jgi:hypothetical protein
MNNIIEKDLLLIIGILGICVLSVYSESSVEQVLLSALCLFGGALKGKS